MSDFDRLEELSVAAREYSHWLSGKRYAAQRDAARPPSRQDMAEAWAVALANALSTPKNRVETP